MLAPRCCLRAAFPDTGGHGTAVPPVGGIAHVASRQPTPASPFPGGPEASAASELRLPCVPDQAEGEAEHPATANAVLVVRRPAGAGTRPAGPATAPRWPGPPPPPPPVRPGPHP